MGSRLGGGEGTFSRSTIRVRMRSRSMSMSVSSGEGDRRGGATYLTTRGEGDRFREGSLTRSRSTTLVRERSCS